MGKKGNTAIFMALMTVVSLLIMIVVIFTLLAIVALLMRSFPALAESSAFAMIAMAVVFIGGTVLAFFIYSRVVKWADKRFTLEDKLYPFFSRKNKRQ